MIGTATVSTVFFIVGLVITAIGVVFVALGRFEKQPPAAAESLDVGAILEQLNKTLELVEKQYRVGIILIAAGLSLIGVGVWLEARDAKDAAEEAAAAMMLLP
jgi:hypothetical protein